MSDEFKCPYPCGWKELNKIVTGNAAYFATATLDDDISDNVRKSGIYGGQVALELIRKCRYIPEGYALVPIEPTERMLDAAQTAVNVGDAWTHKGVYKAMIEAAREEE